MESFQKTILIVDDETFVRQSFADFFEDNLWQVLQAESGVQALDLLDTFTPDAALVDIRLGGMDGNEFISKANLKKRGIFFLICTGSPEYNIPDYLKVLSNVHKTIFRKPVNDIGHIEEVLIKRLNKRT